MQLHRKVKPDKGRQRVFAPGEADLALLGLDILKLSAGEYDEGRSDGREVAAVILAGTCRARVGEARWDGLGRRENVFSGRATTVYIPPSASYRFDAETDVEIALCSAPGGRESDTPVRGPYVVSPEDVIVHDRGTGACRRKVQDIIAEDRPATHLVVGETFNEPGLWSSYPPHKHDVDEPPVEYKMEEIYLFKVDPPQGFGVQGLYSKDPKRPLDEAHIVRADDAVALPYGYHPVAAAPGYRLYYLWFLAGSTRKLVPNDDPDHAWAKEA